MRTAFIVTVSAGAVIGAALTAVVMLNPVYGSATSTTRSVMAGSQASLHTTTSPAANRQGAGDPPTTLTFTVTGGALTMTAPASADLGSGPPGTVISGLLGTVLVTDTRALISAAWTVTASSTNFTTGTRTGPETIPASDATYTPGTVTPTGTITPVPSSITLSASAQTVVAGTAGSGNNTASWDPTIAVSVPSTAVSGGYTGTLSESVS